VESNDEPQLTQARPTLDLAGWVASTSSTDLPDNVRHQVRRNLVDYFAAAFAGSQTEAATIVRGYVAQSDHDASATVIGTRLRLSASGAAIANGTAAHALDLDDGYTPGACHPSAPIVSAVLATAERLDSSAEDVVHAIALGYEVAVRMAGASHPSQHRRGFHNTALVGTFGSATGVAVLHGADAKTIAGAFGNAGSHAGGLLSFLDEGSDIKRYHAGKAARDGLVSAELAIAGLTGPTNVLEGEHGYFHAFAGDEFDREHLMDGLGVRWRMLDTYNKPYPCCRHVHGAIDAALIIRERDGFDVDLIESVRVDTFAIAASHNRKDVKNTMDAQMSLPYSVAAALVAGDVAMHHFEREGRSDVQIVAITEATDVVTDDRYTDSYPGNRPARVTIRSGGRNFVEEVLQPYGEPSNPMSDADLDRKFHEFVGPVVGGTQADQLSAAVWGFEGDARLWSLLPAEGE
jgi:2-methylcitrate dehydratase PrpD